MKCRSTPAAAGAQRRILSYGSNDIEHAQSATIVDGTMTPANISVVSNNSVTIANSSLIIRAMKSMSSTPTWVSRTLVVAVGVWLLLNFKNIVSCACAGMGNMWGVIFA